jgi:DNA polymerase-3 subunit alpha
MVFIMSQHFTHLHLHTEFSLLDGAIRIPELIKFAKQQEWKAIGVSDHGNIFGAVKLFQQAKKENIKPVLGIEMYFTPDVTIKDAKEKYHHLLVIVQNKAGYKNLCKLISLSYQQGFYFKPRIDYAMLEKHSEGLIITSACVGGHIPSLLREGNIDEAKRRTDWFLHHFGPERFFFELQPTTPTFEKQIITNQLLTKYSKEWGVKCTCSCDAHYLRKEDKEAHEVMLSIQTKDQLTNPDRFTFGDCNVYVRTAQEMLEEFKEQPEAVWNTGYIADQCDFAFEFGKLLFPQFPIPTQYTQNSYFEQLCKDGLEKLKHDDLIPQDQYEKYDHRLALEIDLIIKMGFVGYFLVVSDFIQWAKKQNIPVGPGRGSAAGSLVAWTMQITNVDPIKYNLLFERFLNPERVTMPDIDIDFCIERREEVINYVKDKYGHDCVCQIITFGTMMAKGVIKDVARALGFPFQDANAITDLIPDQLKITLEEAIEQEPKIKQLIDSNPQVKRLFDICFKLEGLTRHASKHAAGVVISPENLADCLPLFVPAKGNNELVSQYAMTELEAVGFLKMDFLGLQNLTVIERALKAIKKNHGIDINLDKLPFDDKKTFDLICKGQTKGVFQFESEGIGEVLRKLQPDKFEDLIAVNALYRPGPLGSGMVDDYIDRRHGRKPTTYMFPELEPVLAETYGVIVYQEQVMKIASVIGGYTLGGADILRRAMGKKKVDVMAQQKALFVEGAKKGGFDEKKAAELFELMEYFAGYGFNKSHSAAYALIAYHTAYLKANYPREFMAAVVSFETDNPDNLTKYLQEIHDMGITTISPSINSSDIEFVANDEGVIFGLKGIKNVGLAALQNIIEERAKKPFTDLLEFCKRVDLRTANKRVIESLICAGAMDCLPGNRAQKTAELDKIIDLAHEQKEAAKTGQMGLFGMISEENTEKKDSVSGYFYQPLPDWSDKVKLEKEKEVAGFYLSSHPLKTIPALKWLTHTQFVDALEMIKHVNSIKEPFVTCVGLMQTHKVINTKKGDKMAFAQFEDLSGSAEVIIFPSLYAKAGQLLDQHNVFIIKGTLDITAQTNCKIKANELIPAELLFQDPELIKSITLTLPDTITEDLLQMLKNKVKLGGIPLQLAFYENERKLVVLTGQKIAGDFEQLNDLASSGFVPHIGL